MEVTNVEKGVNNGQAILTLPDGSKENLSGVNRVKTFSNIITIKDPSSGDSFSLNFDNPGLNKQGQVSAQGLVNFWFDNNFLMSGVMSTSTSLEVPTVDNEVSAIVVADEFSPSKTFSKLLDVQLGGNVVNLNRITFIAGVIDFLDGAVIGEDVKIVGIIEVTAETNKVLTAEVDLSRAELLVGNTTPKEAIAAPGAGKAIALVGSAYASYTFVSVAYITNLTLDIILAGGTVLASFSSILGGAVSKARISQVVEQEIVKTLLENQAVNVIVNTGDASTGNGTAKVIIPYMIIDL